MTHLLVTSLVAPVMVEPGLQSEQVTQLLLGEGARVLDTSGEYRRVATSLDGAEGWVHRGYTLAVDRNRHDGWLGTAGWSGGGTVTIGSQDAAVPHRARLQLEGAARVRLPDGRSAAIAGGAFRSTADWQSEARAVAPATWAWGAFGEAPYLWGGLTRGGIDCSGLVQTTFLARGVPLPRNARDQVEVGLAVATDTIEAGDLLFFRDAASRDVTHVAIADGDDGLVHASLAAGRVVRERWGADGSASPLRPLLVAVRRLT